MALNVQVLYDDASRMFGSSGLGGKFELDFISAVNFLLDKLSFAGDLSTAIGHIQAVDESISELDVDDYHILLAGLEWKLKDFGSINSKSALPLYREAKAQWEDAKADFMVKKHREDLEDTDDDGDYDNDIIGLGDKGA